MARESMLGTVVAELKRAKKKGRTVNEIAEATGVGTLTVRKHLATLMERGDADREQLEPTGPGRPPHVYFLTAYRQATAA